MKECSVGADNWSVHTVQYSDVPREGGDWTCSVRLVKSGLVGELLLSDSISVAGSIRGESSIPSNSCGK